MPLSPKSQELFQDLLDMAYQECGFEIGDDSQLVVERTLTVDSIVVVMTKVCGSYGCEHLNVILPQAYETEEDDEGIVIDRGADRSEFTDLEACSQACQD